MKLYSMLIVFIVMNSVLFAQSIDSELSRQLKSAIDSVVDARKIRGASVGILFPEKVTWVNASGFSSQTELLKPEMLMGIGSNTKTFTSVLLLKLQEEGLLNLNDTIGKWIAKHPFIDTKITIRQLLNHTSGLGEYAGNDEYRAAVLNDALRIWEPEELLQFIGKKQFDKGTDWSYTNTNYLIAGIIATKITGKKMSVLYRKYIIDPLNLAHTFFPVEEELKGEIAHRWINNTDLFNVPINAAFSGAWAAGAIFSTSSDMVKWYDALMDKRILNQNSLDQMFTFVGSENYGLGISRKTIEGVEIIGNTGEIRGYSSMTFYIPVYKVSCSILTNQLPSVPAEIGRAVIKILNKNILTSSNQQLLNSNKIIPNPVSHTFHLAHYSGNVTIFDMKGRVRWTGFTRPNEKIDVSSFDNGMYLLKTSQSVNKLMVKK